MIDNTNSQHDLQQLLEQCNTLIRDPSLHSLSVQHQQIDRLILLQSQLDRITASYATLVSKLTPEDEDIPQETI